MSAYYQLRRQVAFEAARLLYAREESEYHRAKLRAARQIYGGDYSSADLPRNREIRDQILEFARADRRQLRPDQLGRMPDLLPAHKQPPDQFLAFTMLLEPLERVQQDRDAHPEGDALYHSLQVFELARQALPYDEEFLLAALLHDVGKAIDPREHVVAALEVLEGLITPRTAWLIEHHEEALAYSEGNLGARLRRRLQSAEDFDELMLLAQCDRGGRRIGMTVPDVPEALDYLRELAESCDG
jgi:hypothetical protein